MARYYSKVGTNEIIVDSRTRPVCPATYIEMMEDRPTPEHIAKEDGSWVIPLENIKAKKLAELSHLFKERLTKAYVKSSLGFTADANETALRNIDGLILTLGAKEKIIFRTYDNQFEDVGKKDLEILKKEIILETQKLYRDKWDFEELIHKATSAKEVLSLLITF